MTSSLNQIREQEKIYHDNCYANHELFAPGSWLHKPVSSVLHVLSSLPTTEESNVLDLGCGVGRNCIPIAQNLAHHNSKVYCVDLLESAVLNLRKYAEQYQVIDKMAIIKSDIGQYEIMPDYFDYIFSVSALEHLASEDDFVRVLKSMVDGTKSNGFNHLLINSDIKETLVASGKELPVMFELNFSSEQLLDKLQSIYRGWKLIDSSKETNQIEIEREGQPVFLQSNVIKWTVQKVL